jgi:signal peptidase I
MAKVIEFYVPKDFRNTFVRDGQPQPGEVIEFCSQSTKSGPTRPAGGVLGWLLAETGSNHAVESESSSHPGVA